MTSALRNPKIVNYRNVVGLSKDCDAFEATYPILFISLDSSDNKGFTRGAVHIVKQLVPEFKNLENDQFAFQFFTEGITNKLVCITAIPTGFKVVLRTYGNYTEYLVDRRQEAAIMNAYGQKVYGGFLNGIVYAFTPGRTMDYVEFRKPEITKKMAECVANMHHLSPKLTKEPILFKEMRAWLHNLPTTYLDPEKQKKFTGIKYDDLLKEIEYTEKKLTALNSPLVCGHNDLYLKNFIINDEDQTIKLIDFEYASWNFQAFDLANHITEWCGVIMDFSKYPNRQEQDFFLRTYLETYNGKAPTDEEVDKLYDVVNQFQLATNLLWAIWGFVDAALSTIEWDYMDYAWLRLNKYYELKKKL
ncbi:ethanolamine kinase, putative [Entamoeba invadens IP1]|uniref:ethanolamine kinase n=1 Tax=Entamoeba invadens IP1 TaxID=370355 RepID=A0A0A1U2K4_ENTIV|nr:ethanolamine kinase, putative [Entamoeba invadens IP1]ELP88292.1 ethanolamine kinase, putative [Entamoeba invadens IP1]|eukprot:XP_004255063.1 ethanolamine kinase, putative [Entamoeba invadens IP1]